MSDDDFFEETTSDSSSGSSGDPDTFVEESTTGWGSRIINSIGGILVGLALIVGSGILLFWNEGRTVKTTLGLNEAASVLVSADSNAVNPSNNNKLVHVTGEMTTAESLKDPEFGVSMNAIGLKRVVEIYQWHEREKTEETKNAGGSSTKRTTYKYEKTWSKDPISSGSFKHPEGHANPTTVLYRGQDSWAGQVNLGKFSLSNSLITKMSNFEPLPLDSNFQSNLPAKFQGKAQIAGEWCYLGNPQSPAVGDERVKFEFIRPGPVSVISRQFGNTFTPFVAKSGKNIEMIEPGIISPDVMFGEARQENMTIAWILRAVGALLMFIAFFLILKPISVMLDVLPFLGNIAEAGIGIVAFMVSVLVSAIIIAVAWMTYRPLLAMAILAGGIALAVLIGKARRRPKPATAG